MFISKYKDAFGVEPVCRVLTGGGWQIAPGIYYAAVKRPPPARARDAQVRAEITRMRAEYIEEPAAVAVLAALLRDARPPPRNETGRRTARPAA